MTVASSAIPVLHKAIRVVEAVAEGRSYRSMTQMAKALEIAPATCYRILKTFEHADWIRLDEQGQPALSLGLLPVLEPLLSFERLVTAARPVLEQLAQTARLSAKLSVRVGDDAATIARAESPEAMSLSSRVGTKFPLVVGSSGSALLSTCDDDVVNAILNRASKACWQHQTPQDVWDRMTACRKTGICMDHGSYHPQVHSMSITLRSTSDRVAAAITILGLPGDFATEANVKHQKHLRAAARRCDQLQRVTESSAEDRS